MPKSIKLKDLPTYWPLYLFILPSVLMVAVFSYFPAGSAMYHAVFRWDGDFINYFIGSTNFKRALGIPWLWAVTLATLVVVITFASAKGKKGVFALVLGGIAAPLVNLVVLAEPIQIVFNGSSLIFMGVVLIPFVISLFLSQDNDNKAIAVAIWGAIGLALILGHAGGAKDAAWSLALLVVSALTWVLPMARKRPRIVGIRISLAISSVGIIFWSLATRAGGDEILWHGFSVILIPLQEGVAEHV